MSVTYKIGEAAGLLNLKTYVLRFWETEFSQIVPLRTEKGQRLYTEEHIALLRRIRHLLHERGLTIEGARRILAEEAARTGGAQQESDLLSLFGREFEAGDEVPAGELTASATVPGLGGVPAPGASFGENSPLHMSAGFEPGSFDAAQVAAVAAPEREKSPGEQLKELAEMKDVMKELEEELENLAVWLRRR